MLKHITKLSFIILFFISSNLFSQTIVGTTQETRKVVLEEFTGIHCVYCPQGHAIANSILESHPEEVLLINIHTGGYAVPNGDEPDFRTAFGSAIASQSNLAGYPAGTVNRHYFPGTSQGNNPNAGYTAQSRGTWSSTANMIFGQETYVNMAVEAELDAQTKELTVHVEAYYTGDSPEATNLLNVALLQDNTKGVQTGGNLGDNYNHMHRLVHLITGQWGESISTTTTGSFIDRTYTYTVPEDYNGVPVNIGDLHIVTFMTETHQEIQNGAGCDLSFTNVLNNDAGLTYNEDILDNCTGSIVPEFNLANNGSTDLTSLDIEYSVNGGTVSNYQWTGNISMFASENITLPAISFDLQNTNELTINVTNTDDNTTNNMVNASFNAVDVEADNENIVVEVKPDNYGSEITWSLIDMSDNSILLSGGPYTDGNTTLVTASTTVSEGGCYRFDINDSYGDGICCGQGNGYYNVINNGNLLLTGGDYDGGEIKGFISSDVFAVGVEDPIFKDSHIFPNPTHSLINITNSEGFNVEIFNILGEKVLMKNKITSNQQIDMSSFSNGTYVVKLMTGQVSKSVKIVLIK